MFELITPPGCASAELHAAPPPAGGAGADAPPPAVGGADPLPVAELRPEARSDLLAAELHLLGRAVPKRRSEIEGGRRCARAALAKLGVGPVAILRGAAGEPIWPEGYVGSITHTGSFRAAVVAPASGFCAIGIDAEPNVPLAERLIERLSTAAEREHLQLLRGAGEGDPRHGSPVHYEHLLFCVKEAAYKAHFALRQTRLDSDQAIVTLGCGEAAGGLSGAGGAAPAGIVAGSATATILSCGPDRTGDDQLSGVPSRYQGRWCADAHLICVLLVVPAAEQAASS